MYYLEQIIYLIFCLVFVLMMSVNRFPIKYTLIAGVLLLIVLAVNSYILLSYVEEPYFEFFYPVVSMLSGMFYVMVISEYNGLKSIFPVLVGAFFVTVSVTIRDFLTQVPEWSFSQAIIGETVFLAAVLIAVGFFLKPFYVTTVKYSSDGWMTVDLSLIIYFLMVFLMYGTMDMRRMLGIRTGLEGIMLIVVISICVFTARTLREQEREYNRFLLKQQAKAGAVQIEAYRESEKRMSVIRHDARHYLGLIDQLLESGKYDEVRDLVNNLSMNIDKTKAEVFCENVYVDAVFAMHVKNAKKEDVNIQIQADIPEELCFDEIQFSVVVSNLIENAVKAAAGMNNMEDRLVTVKARNTGYSQIIEISNKYSGEVILDSKGYPVTDKEGHGIGMVSVDAFAKENGAILDLKAEDGKFKATLLVNY